MTWSDVTETATATVTAHGYSTDDMVSIAGADQPEYNGWFQITVVTADTFSYTVSSSATTPATGSNIQVHLLGDDQIKTTYDRIGRQLQRATKDAEKTDELQKVLKQLEQELRKQLAEVEKQLKEAAKELEKPAEDDKQPPDEAEPEAQQ